MSGRAGRNVARRVCVTGKLTLETPAHFGNGDVTGLADMSLLRDPRDGQSPLLTGTSIAGALRNYVREYEHGYGHAETLGDLAECLFGAVQKREEATTSVQSWLLIDDALGDCLGIELRDGVAIDPKTRTAEEGKKFDVELLEAGTSFDLSFELLLTKDNQDLLSVLALALSGLEGQPGEPGEIGLGLRKRRGLGRCRVQEWSVCQYELSTPQGLIAWLENDRSEAASGSSIFDLLQVAPPVPDRRETFTIRATFKLASSLLIRSGFGAAGDPDMVHLHSKRGGTPRPILSGTSLAGAVRARSLRIANTVLPQGGQELVDEMFGRRIEGRQDKPSGSRVITNESELKGTREWVQSRVKIDRFTGGAFPGALFTQQPVFGGNGAIVTLEWMLQQPKKAEVGLLLLVLKDLWTGDLPLGGESSVGRGRLKGQVATLIHHCDGQTKEWVLTRQKDKLDVTGSGTTDDLEAYVAALTNIGGPHE